MTKPKPRARKSCILCSHAHRHEIEAARVAGCSLDTIAAKYGVSRDAIWRHTSNHMTQAARAAYLVDADMSEIAEKAAKEGGSILAYLALVRSHVVQQMMVAAGVNDGHRVAALAGRAIEVLATIGKFTGELSELRNLTVNNNVTLVNSPAFARLEAMLLTRLKSHPAALGAVLEGLAELEAIDAAPTAQKPPTLTLEAARVE